MFEEKRHTADEARSSIASIKAARAALNKVDDLIAKQDMDAVSYTRPLSETCDQVLNIVEAAPVSTFEADALVILQAPVLSVSLFFFTLSL